MEVSFALRVFASLGKFEVHHDSSVGKGGKKTKLRVHQGEDSIRRSSLH